MKENAEREERANGFEAFEKAIDEGRYLVEGIWRKGGYTRSERKAARIVYGIEEWIDGGWVPVRFESGEIEEVKKAKKLLERKVGIIHEFRVIKFERVQPRIEDVGSVFEKGAGGKSKVDTAVERIKAFCEGRKTLCAFSGGKDSQVCYHLCKEAGIEFTAQYSITRFEPPEVIGFIRKNYPDVQFRRAYRRSLIDDIEKRGLPLKTMRWCCNAKHMPTKGYEVAVVGIRWEESPKRRDTWRMTGRTKGCFYVCPICDWTEKDVWEYLNTKGLEHCCLYDQGMKRIGCVCCPMAPSRMRAEAQRWPKMAKMLMIGHKKSWDTKWRIMKEEGREKLFSEFRDFKTPEESFENWLDTGMLMRIKGAKKDEEPCAFAGSGYSESDGEGEEEGSEATSEAAGGQIEQGGE